MPKTFTITEGLENLGAFKTGGQGSVYKARRSNGVITAIKLLPTPIYSESGDDKNFLSFQNEVEKLRMVNETPNPHVVTILSSGITDTGSFPYIEMEFIEGPDLEEQLKPMHKPVFRISEVVKVARHISEALAHCHKVGVKHGDIKPNNIKLNNRTGNFVLLDFGLALMSDEQRRTSLRHAGAIEFMAPEQNEGKLLFQTDIYSFGVVLYELLAGQVPFPLAAGSESARNNVMVAHMESEPPPIGPLRQQHMPDGWSQDKREYQLDIPAWLLSVVKKCLQKDPLLRYANGMELQAAILEHSLAAPLFPVLPTEPIPPLPDPASTPVEAIVETLPAATAVPVIPVMPPMPAGSRDAADDNELRTRGATKRVDNTLQPAKPKRQRSPALAVGLLLAGLVAIAAVYFLRGEDDKGPDTMGSTEQTEYPATVEDTVPLLPDPTPPEVARKERSATESPEKDAEGKIMANAERQPDRSAKAETPVKAPPVAVKKPVVTDTQNARERQAPAPQTAATTGVQYKVRSKAYFHNEPDENTRRNAFIVHWNNAVLKPLEVKNDFVYIVFTNHLGQTSRGWLRVKDLVKVERATD